MRREAVRRVLRLFTSRDAREEVDEELETHIELRARELERSGLDVEAARAEARRRAWRAGAPSLRMTALHQTTQFTVATDESAWRAPGQYVVGDFFDVIGAPMLRGRAFTEEEVAAGARLAVVSEGFWRDSLVVLWAAVLFVLLIACVNVAGLGLAQGATRSGEMHVRTSLGAARTRLVRQLLAEQLVLAFVGAGLGLLLVGWVTGLVADRAAAFLPRAGEVALDLRTLLFAVTVTLVAGVSAGLLPALRVSPRTRA